MRAEGDQALAGPGGRGEDDVEPLVGGPPDESVQHLVGGAARWDEVEQRHAAT
jgi:hypothetical protein